MTNINFPPRLIIYMRYLIRRVAYLIPPCGLKNSLLRASGINIGKKVFIGDGVKLIDGYIRKSIILEDNCVLAPSVILIACSYPEGSLLANTGKYNKYGVIMICSGAWVGAGAIILPGITVGELTIIGAGSVLTKSTSENQVWFGNPAKCVNKGIPREDLT